jgi:hypothetical protein
LFKLAQANVAKYPSSHEQLDTAALLATIKDWLERLEASDYSLNPLMPESAPSLQLIEFQ